MTRLRLDRALVTAVALCAGPPLFAAPAAPALPPNVERIASLGDVTQYRLKSNGMTILLARTDAAPVFSFLVVYHVGSRNEAPGNTGSAHLLEHLLFNKSTANFGKASGHPTFQEALYAAGADFTSTNMTTWNDRMTGYSTLPAGQLDLAMRIEADRLGRGLILDSERGPEMSVVRNEYEIGENDPSQALFKAVIGASIVAHPYHWDTIGYRSDIEGVSTATLRGHYENFFWPDNAEAVLTGDFDPSEALRLFDRHFGAFPRSPRPIPRVITVEPPQEGERRVVVKRPGQLGIVQVACIRPGAPDPDFVPLDLVNAILGTGVNSRLYQALVETGLASAVSAVNYPFRDAFPLVVEAVVAPGRTHEAVEAAVRKTLGDVASGGVTDVELERARRQLEVSLVQARDGTFPLAAVLGEAIASADWKWALTYPDTVRSATKEDVGRVAKKYLDPDRMTVGWFVPVDPSEAPALKGDAAAAPAAAAAPQAGAIPEKPLARGFAAAAPPAPAAASAARVTFAKRTLRKVLPNGLILDVVENHAVPTVSVSGIVLAGGMTAPDGKPALPGLTAMMLTRGTQARDKLAAAAQLEGAGATLTIAAGPTQTDIAGGAMSRDLPMLLEILADDLKNPVFPAEEIEKAKAEMTSTVLRAADSTNARAWDRMSQITFPEGHPYRAATPDVMQASIRALTAGDLRGFHQNRYGGAATILAIAGDVDAARTAEMVGRLFGSLPKGSRPEFTEGRTAPAQPVREAVTLRGKANMSILFGQASGLRRLDPDYEASLIANAALGQTALSSRVGKRVRDKEGLSYSLNSRFWQADALDGMWGLMIAVAPQNAARAIASAKDEIETYARDGITEDEVRIQKSYFAGNYQVRLGSNAGVAGALAAAEKIGGGPAYLDEFPERIRRVTREQANAAIKAHLSPAAMSLVVAGDLDTVPDAGGGAPPKTSGATAQ